MRREAEIKHILISNAIHLIAKGGFEAATTKALTTAGDSPEGVKMNEVYIYRIFGSKENLYEAAFLTLDDELYRATSSAVEKVGGFGEDAKNRLHQFFGIVWDFLLGNEERFRCYVRYYHSIYFKGSSQKTHAKHFESMVKLFAPLFEEDAAAGNVLHSAFIILLNFAVQVYNGDVQNDENMRNHAFNILFFVLESYFNTDIKKAILKEE